MTFSVHFRFLFASERFDFTDHDQFCTHLCVPAKEALLIELAEENCEIASKVQQFIHILCFGLLFFLLTLLFPSECPATAENWK